MGCQLIYIFPIRKNFTMGPKFGIAEVRTVPDLRLSTVVSSRKDDKQNLASPITDVPGGEYVTRYSAVILWFSKDINRRTDHLLLYLFVIAL